MFDWAIFQKNDVLFQYGFLEELFHVKSRVRCLDVLHGVGFMKVVVPVEVPALLEGLDDSDGHGDAEVQQTQQAGQASEHQQNAGVLPDKNKKDTILLTTQR